MLCLYISVILLCKYKWSSYAEPYHCIHYLIGFAAILLAGCSSYSSMTNIYVLGLSYINSTQSNLSESRRNLSETLSAIKGSAQLEVRIGYFGMCIRQRGIVWLCSSDATGLMQQIGSENDPLGLIYTGSKFKSDVLFSGLLFMAVILAFLCSILLATFPGWHTERDMRTGSEVDVKPFPSRPISLIASIFALSAAVISLIADIWQHVGSVGAAAMAQTANNGNVNSVIGAGAMALGWTGFALLTIVAIGLLVMITAIAALDRLTEER